MHHQRRSVRTTRRPPPVQRQQPTDAYKIYTATDKAKAVAEVVAGWTAAGVAGGDFATAFAPADVAGPFAWAAHGIGTLVVGGVAYWVGSTTTRIIYELVIEGKPITIGPE